MSTWTPLTFGKYRGKTLPQVAFIDPDWFFYMFEQGVFQRRELFRLEAQRVWQRARAIRIPAGYRVEYHFAWDGSLFDVFIVRGARNKAASVEAIDLSLARQLKPYDKAGGRELVTAIKHTLFSGARLTKNRVEGFFDDARNFLDLRRAQRVVWVVRMRRRRTPR